MFLYKYLVSYSPCRCIRKNTTVISLVLWIRGGDVTCYSKLFDVANSDHIHQRFCGAYVGSQPSSLVIQALSVVFCWQMEAWLSWSMRSKEVVICWCGLCRPALQW